MAKLKKVFCANCKKPIYRSTGRINENIKFEWNSYCSKKCLSQSRTKKILLVCENCSRCFQRIPSKISPHNYCSKSCATIVNNTKNPNKKAKFKTCIKCGKQFKKSTGNLKYCSIKCRGGRKPKYTSQNLTDIIGQKAKELQRVPTRREMERIGNSCKRVFGSWNNAVIATGLKPNRSHNQRMYKCAKIKAIDGHLCDSVSEAIIDNWLIKNKIAHKINVSYPKTRYTADWVISINGQKVFIEYFGLANDSPRYDRTIRKKKAFCRKHKLALIEIYPQDIYPKKNLNNRLKNKFKNFIGTTTKIL